MRAAEAVAVAALVIGSPLAARADGAFPAGQAVLVPEDRPQELLLVTNFGVVLSEDGGATWTWSCEQDANALATLYQRGPAPRQRLFAVANQQIVYSDDATCSWQVAGGLIAGQAMSDLFPDPTNADRVVAIGVAGDVGSVFESADGGATFDTVLYQAAAGEVVTSVEIARSDPRVVYVALEDQDQHPKLARSSDAGAHWTVTDLSSDVGVGLARIIAIDPDDADTVILRWSSQAGGEAVAVSHDGGTTASKPLTVPLYFTSFARLPDGALVLSAVVAVSPATKTALFVSRDGAATFQENDAVPSVAALAQRDGVLYAATDNFADGYALGASTDLGTTWEPVVRFDQVASIMACLQANPQCQASCESLAGNGLASPGQIWDESVCTTGATPTGGAGGGGMNLGGAAGAPGVGGHGSSGGGCTMAPDPAGPSSVLVAGLIAAALGVCAARRRRAPHVSRRVQLNDELQYVAIRPGRNEPAHTSFPPPIDQAAHGPGDDRDVIALHAELAHRVGHLGHHQERAVGSHRPRLRQPRVPQLDGTDTRVSLASDEASPSPDRRRLVITVMADRNRRQRARHRDQVFRLWPAGDAALHPAQDKCRQCTRNTAPPHTSILSGHFARGE